ncbi:MAG: phosphate ABC transporter permease PstA [Spirochaetales bacterium]|nr:phosphate ABC transporter permease PstA [Spirochaetales bacterium]MBP7264037.1 phosphate ABC transporter permease PstA [Spirochaetia bacterium]
MSGRPDPSRAGFDDRLDERKAKAGRWKAAFLAAASLAVVSLAVLVLSIVDDAFGYVVIRYAVNPAELTDGRELAELTDGELLELLQAQAPARRLRALEREAPLAGRGHDELLSLIEAEILKPEIAAAYSLAESLFDKRRIVEESKAEFPDGYLSFRSWLSPSFLGSSLNAKPLSTGVLTAIKGTFLTILVAMATALPLGVAAAVWLEEYARDNWLNRLIQASIYNLAGVPSIVYGMLGLAVFVRLLAPLSSGAVFGLAAEGMEANGRTVLAAGLTLALLVLPVIVISTQEALKAIPSTLRASSLALGATRWQTVWHHVLPASAGRVMTGAVLALSRAIGETAPLVVVGASTFLTQDPTGIFSPFTTLPIQIYQWTSRPQPEFRHLAAAAIITLLGLMLILNAFAIVARQKARAKGNPS